MRIRILYLLLLIAASSESKPKKYLDQHDNEDNFILWGSLFTKINTILNETARLSDSLVKLNERQDAQEHKLNIFMENAQKHFMDLKKGQNAQERLLNNFMEQQSNNDSNDNNEWTTILRRQDGSVDFYRNWTEYQKGFGHPDGEFFIGMDKLYAMTALVEPQELMVVLKDFENETRIAKYDIFKIGNEREKYALTVLGEYSGDAGDALAHHRGMKFTTYDQDNDILDVETCAKNWRGAWWFRRCYWSHLFGPYRPEEHATNSGVGWNTWKGQDYSLKFVEMKIRSISF